MTDRVALYDLSYDQMAALLAGWGQPGFRVDQLWHWLYRSLAGDFESMTNLPGKLRERLAAETELTLLRPQSEQVSASGQTRKVLFCLRDDNAIESVRMDYYDRRTACISTQAGCGMGCTFCATGQMGLTRNLSPGEIVAQVLFFAREIRQQEIERATALGIQAEIPEHPISNVVLMGMGEPLANYEADRGYNLGARRMTLSTVGLVPGIRRLAGQDLPINLAVSLHAPDDELRHELIPVSRRYPLHELMAAVRAYAEKTRRRVTIEYALIDGLNDSLTQARELAALLAGLLCHVNLIPLNPTEGCAFEPSPRERVERFRDTLRRSGIAVTVRLRRGVDLQAGCGQLCGERRVEYDGH